MRLLVIGGTVFVGRAVVGAALERGWEVAIFHRGRHNLGVHGPEVDERLGDRRTSLAALGDEDAWDVVVDTCAYDPADIDRSAAVLSERAGRYVLVSSASVYRDWPARPVPDESAPVWEAGRGYGPNKAACERRLAAVFGDRALAVRAGVIVGPYENIGRLPYWLSRMARGGFVLAPGPAQATLQWIDARDLAAWMLDAAAAGTSGPVNAVAPPGFARWGEVLAACRDVVNPSAELRWVDGAQVAARLRDPWSELPLWPAPGAEVVGIYEVGAARAAGLGLRCRPPAGTVADTWAWLRLAEPDEGAGWRVEVQAAGLGPERERELLEELPRPGGA